MAGVSSSRPDMPLRDDAAKIAGRPSREGSVRTALPQDEGGDDAPDFAALLKKAGSEKAMPQTGSDAAKQTRGTAEAADSQPSLEPGPLDPKLGRAERDGRGKAEAEADGEPGPDRQLGLRNLLASWSEPGAAPAVSADGAPTRPAPEAAIAAALATRPASVAAEPAGDDRSTAPRESGSTSAHSPDHPGRQRPAAIMPGEVKPAPMELRPSNGGAAPAGTPAPIVMSADIIDRQTHFAPVDTLARGQRAAPGRLNPADDAAKGPAGVSRAEQAGGSGTVVEEPQSATDDEAAADPRLPIRERSSDAVSSDRPGAREARARDGGDGPATAGTTAAAGATSTTPSPAAPGLPTATLQRLAGSILATAGELAASQSAAPASAEGSAATDRGPVRVLDLELTPADLGLVRVRLRLIGNGIDLQIAAARPTTAEYLQEDRHRLSAIVENAGYDIDSLTVQTSGDGFRSHILPSIRQDAAPNPAQTGGAFQPQADAGAQSHNGRGGSPDQRSSPSHLKEIDGSQVQEGERSRPGSLYV
ncbi:chemotaxis protein MotD [Amorphus suaedae]